MTLSSVEWIFFEWSLKKVIYHSFFISSTVVFNNKNIMPTEKNGKGKKKNLASQEVLFIKKRHLHVRKEKSSHPQPPPPPHCGRDVPLPGGEGGIRVKCDLLKWGSKCANWATPSIHLFLTFSTQVLSVNLVHISHLYKLYKHVSTWCHSPYPLFCSCHRFFFTTSKNLNFIQRMSLTLSSENRFGGLGSGQARFLRYKLSSLGTKHYGTISTYFRLLKTVMENASNYN